MLLETNDNGLYCAAGDFYIDPWRPVARALITHAHADHARPGSRAYLTAASGEHVVRGRMEDGARIETIPYGEKRTINGVTVSFHPAGHVLGSAQIRVEHRGEVWVASGDYKAAPDATCATFEPVPCHTFITEATFALPIYRWPEQAKIFQEINAWWRANQGEEKASVLFAYSLGKAQRILAGIDATIGPIYAHGAVQLVNERYRRSGVDLPATIYATDAPADSPFNQSLIIAPPGTRGTPWLRRFGRQSTAFASGWTRVRGQRRRRSVDRGFVLSDHVDWPELLQAITDTSAERVLATHGYVSPLVRWLREQGLEAAPLSTPYAGEEDDDE